jgi:hypothetical protein
MRWAGANLTHSCDSLASDLLHGAPDAWREISGRMNILCLFIFTSKHRSNEPWLIPAPPAAGPPLSHKRINSGF